MLWRNTFRNDEFFATSIHLRVMIVITIKAWIQLLSSIQLFVYQIVITKELFWKQNNHFWKNFWFRMGTFYNLKKSPKIWKSIICFKNDPVGFRTSSCVHFYFSKWYFLLPFGCILQANFPFHWLKFKGYDVIRSELLLSENRKAISFIWELLEHRCLKRNLFWRLFNYFLEPNNVIFDSSKIQPISPPKNCVI